MPYGNTHKCKKQIKGYIFPYQKLINEAKVAILKTAVVEAAIFKLAKLLKKK